MTRGDKSRYSSKQKRMALQIEEGYGKRGDAPKAAAGKAWATVNKATKTAGNDRVIDDSPIKKGDARGDTKAGAKADMSTKRSAAARKGWETRRAKTRAKSAAKRASR